MPLFLSARITTDLGHVEGPLSGVLLLTGAGADHGAGVPRADDVPDHVRAGRVATLLRDARADPTKTRSRARDLPAGDQPGHVGHQHAGEVAGRVPPHPAALLRPLGLDHHHARVHATRHLLPLPLHRVSLRDLEAGLQDEAHVHVEDLPG